jgi:hypothetical protein
MIKKIFTNNQKYSERVRIRTSGIHSGFSEAANAIKAKILMQEYLEAFEELLYIPKAKSIKSQKKEIYQ